MLLSNEDIALVEKAWIAKDPEDWLIQHAHECKFASAHFNVEALARLTGLPVERVKQIYDRKIGR
jgi:hypothetical protein